MTAEIYVHPTAMFKEQALLTLLTRTGRKTVWVGGCRVRLVKDESECLPAPPTPWSTKPKHSA